MTKAEVGVRTAVFNLVNAAIGAGILAIPSTFRNAGIVGGLVCAIVVVVLMRRTALIISKKADRMSANPTYQDLVAEYLGNLASKFVSVALIVYIFGVSIGLFIIVGHQMQAVMNVATDNHTLTNKYFLQVLFCSILSFPWTLAKSIDRLAPSGILCLVSCSYVLVVGITKSIIEFRQHGFHGYHYFDLIGVFQALPVFCFAYQFHLQIPLVFAVLKGVRPDSSRDTASLQENMLKSPQPTPYHKKLLEPESEMFFETREDSLSPAVGKINLAVAWTFGICYVLYSLFGVSTYLQFGPNTKSDILQNYGDDDMYAAVARALIALTACLSYPVNFFAARVALLSYLPHHPAVFYVVTVVWYLCALGIALVVDDLGVVFSLIGASVGVVVIFILPGLIALCDSPTTLQRVEGYFVITAGFVIGIAGILFLFYKP